MKTGVIDVGGGLRGIYAVGIFDYCMDHNIHFDLGIGISAGSANLASFAAGQKGRNHTFYTEYAFRKQYMSMRNFIFKRSFIDLDYVYSTLSNTNGENPLNYCAIRDNPMKLYVIAANAQTGEATYFDKNDIRQDDYDIFKASCAIPFVCKPYEIKGIPYYDGALGNPVPIEKAFQMGCDRVVLILTKPEKELRTADRDKKVAARIRKKYPKAAEKLCQRAERYNAGVSTAQKYVKEGKALILSPDDTCGVSTLTKNKISLQRLYEKGYQDGEKILSFLNLKK
jgi:predicted patatin/cPLA2 family phospholipase